MANSNFYANIGVNAGFTRSRSNTSSHTEGAAVTTLKPMDENSSITYNNVNNITYQGTQAQGGTFIYNNVANIQKEAVELHNSYTSSSSSRGNKCRCYNWLWTQIADYWKWRKYFS